MQFKRNYMVVIDWVLKSGAKRFVEPVKSLQSVQCVGPGSCETGASVLHLTPISGQIQLCGIGPSGFSVPPAMNDSCVYSEGAAGGELTNISNCTHRLYRGCQ